MAKKTLSVVYPCSPATHEKVLALTAAVRAAAQRVGFADFAVPIDALLDFPPIAKDLHGRWKTAEADLTKKRLPEKEAINASLVRQANGSLACAFHASIGTADKTKGGAPCDHPNGTLRVVSVRRAEITVWLSEARATTYHDTRQTVIDAAAEAGLRGFTFPRRDTFLAQPLAHLPAAAQTQADTILGRSGFASSAERWYIIVTADGRVGFRFMSAPSTEATAMDDFEESGDGLDFSVLRLHCATTVSTVIEATAETVGETLAATTSEATHTVAESMAERVFRMFSVFVRDMLAILRR